jgi:tetratricopeptide (TPR) repeat protein
VSSRAPEPTRSGRALVLGVAALLAAGCAAAPARPADPLSAEEHNDLGLAYYRRGDHAAAAREFLRALALQPGLTRARVNLGDALLAQGAVEAAIAAYETARAARPDDPAIANNLAWALLQHERRWPEAEPLIREALARGPEPRGYYLDTLGVVLLRRDAPREALAAFRAALADASLRDRQTLRLILRHAGDALTRLGERAAAERCYRLAEAPPLPVETAAPDGAGAAKVGGSDPVC